MEHVGNMVHELGHALGLGHEQKRPDRDQYVLIHWDKMVDESGKDWWSSVLKAPSSERQCSANTP